MQVYKWDYSFYLKVISILSQHGFLKVELNCQLQGWGFNIMCKDAQYDRLIS